MDLSNLKTSLYAAIGLTRKHPQIRQTNIKSYIVIILGVLTGWGIHEFAPQLGHIFGHYWYGTECPAVTKVAPSD